jgi:hypothetical protein
MTDAFEVAVHCDRGDCITALTQHGGVLSACDIDVMMEQKGFERLCYLVGISYQQHQLMFYATILNKKLSRRPSGLANMAASLLEDAIQKQDIDALIKYVPAALRQMEPAPAPQVTRFFSQASLPLPTCWEAIPAQLASLFPQPRPPETCRQLL